MSARESFSRDDQAAMSTYTGATEPSPTSVPPPAADTPLQHDAPPPQPDHPPQQPAHPVQHPRFPSQQPDALPQQPGALPQQPGALPQQPGAPPQQPGAPPQQPGAPSQQPGAPSQQPGAPPQQPGAPPQQPGYPPQQPGYPPQQPVYPQPQQGPPIGQSPYPQGQQTHTQNGYPPGQPPYPPGQPPYPPGQPGYPPGQPGYPPGQPSYAQPQPGYPPNPQAYPQPQHNFPPPPGAQGQQFANDLPESPVYPPQRVYYPLPPLTFPLTATVLGAHTELGKLLVRELSRSPDIDVIYAFAESDPRDDLSIHPDDTSKLRLHITSLDFIEDAIASITDEIDLAFCALGGDPLDIALTRPYHFHTNNLHIPRRFLSEMFRLSARRLSFISHPAASASARARSRASEFRRVYADLEHAVREMQREAGPYASGVSAFRIPLLLTNLKNRSGSGKISTADQVRQKAALKLGSSPDGAVHVRDVAKAMVADAFKKLRLAEESREIDPAFHRRDIRYAVLHGKQVVELASERRDRQRRASSRRQKTLPFEKRVSAYSRREAAFPRSSVSGSRASYVQSGEGSPTFYDYDEVQEDGPIYREPSPSNSNGSFRSGPPPPGNDGAPINGMGPPLDEAEPAFVPYDADGGPPPGVLPRGPRHFREESADPRDDGEFYSPEHEIPRRRSLPIGSVEALGNQLSHRLTHIQENEYLPVVDQDSVPSPQDQARYGRESPRLSRHDSAQRLSPPRIPRRRSERMVTDRMHQRGRYDENQPRRSHTASLRSQHSAHVPAEARLDSPPGSSGRRQMKRGDSPAQRPGMRRRSRNSRSFNRSYWSEPRTSARNSAGRDGDDNGGGSFRRSSAGRYDSYNDSSFRRNSTDQLYGVDGPSNRADPRSMREKITAFAERVIAATDRPSHKRGEQRRRSGSHRRKDDQPDDRRRSSFREGGDSRLPGKTTI